MWNEWEKYKLTLDCHRQGQSPPATIDKIETEPSLNLRGKGCDTMYHLGMSTLKSLILCILTFSRFLRCHLLYKEDPLMSAERCITLWV